MARFYAGSVIKEHRTRRGITQDILCAGICSKTTLHRIEAGKNSPSVYVFSRLMERLGINASNFYFSASSLVELSFYNTYHEINTLITGRNYEEATIKMPKLMGIECQLDKDDGSNIREQMILTLRCGIAQGRGEDAIIRQEMVLSALLLSIPNFDENDIAERMLTYDEISLLNMLATAYSDLGKTEKTINILYQVKQSMDKFYLDEHEKIKGYSMTLYNLADTLGLDGRHSETLEICEIAIQHCVRFGNARLLPYIKFYKACALYYSNKMQGYEKLLIESIIAIRIQEDLMGAKIREDFIKNEMGLEMPF